QQPVVTALLHLLARHQEDLAHAGADDLGQVTTGHGLDAVAAHLVDVDALFDRDHVGQGVAVAELERLGLGQRGPEPDRDVVGDVVAAHREHGQPEQRDLVVHGDVGGAGPDVDHAAAQVDLVRGQHGLPGGKPLADHVVDVEAGLVHALDHVLKRGLGAGDDVG